MSMFRWLYRLFAPAPKTLKKYVLYMLDGSDKKFISIVEDYSRQKALVKAMINLTPEYSKQFWSGKIFGMREYRGEKVESSETLNRPGNPE